MAVDRIARVIDKYCRTYAEEEVARLENFPRELCFGSAIVIPAYREDPAFLQRLRLLAEEQGRLLSVIVINQPDSDSDIDQSLTLWNFARQSGSLHWQGNGLALVEWRQQSFLLLVDRFDRDRRLPAKQGVGLARKIGCDLAIELYRREQLKTAFIHNSDADAHLPTDYFRQTHRLPDQLSAAIYSFQHQTDDQPLGRATALYEQSLHYYVRGLTWAGSPYAFHTIGSCLAVSPGHYCMARGFPRRAGGEDFYLLNKLAKLAPVMQLEGSPIRLEARHSGRVPFGTGPAVEKILSLPDPQRFSTYNPRVFLALAETLDQFNGLAMQRRDHRAWLDAIPEPMGAALRALGIEDLLLHLQNQGGTQEQYRRNIQNWFDGFRTLKFIHHLQDHHYPPVPLAVAQVEANKLWREFRAESSIASTGPTVQNPCQQRPS